MSLARMLVLFASVLVLCCRPKEDATIKASAPNAPKSTVAESNPCSIASPADLNFQANAGSVAQQVDPAQLSLSEAQALPLGQGAFLLTGSCSGANCATIHARMCKRGTQQCHNGDEWERLTDQGGVAVNIGDELGPDLELVARACVEQEQSKKSGERCGPEKRFAARRSQGKKLKLDKLKTTEPKRLKLIQTVTALRKEAEKFKACVPYASLTDTKDQQLWVLADGIVKREDTFQLLAQDVAQNPQRYQADVDAAQLNTTGAGLGLTGSCATGLGLADTTAQAQAQVQVEAQASPAGAAQPRTISAETAALGAVSLSGLLFAFYNVQYAGALDATGKAGERFGKKFADAGLQRLKAEGINPAELSAVLREEAADLKAAQSESLRAQLATFDEYSAEFEGADASVRGGESPLGARVAEGTAEAVGRPVELGDVRASEDAGRFKDSAAEYKAEFDAQVKKYEGDLKKFSTDAPSTSPAKMKAIAGIAVAVGAGVLAYNSFAKSPAVSGTNGNGGLNLATDAGAKCKADFNSALNQLALDLPQ